MSERQMTIILLGVMGAIILLGAGLLYYLRFQELATLEEELTRVKNDVAVANEKKNNIPKLKEKKRALTEEIERNRSMIPVFSPKDENDQFANLVDALRKKTRVQISSARFTPPRTGGPGEELPPTIFRARYEFKVSGGFYQLLNYLNHLESENRFLVADTIKISAGPGSERGSTVRDMQLNLSTYLQRPQQVPQLVKPPPQEKPPEAPPEEKRPSTPIPD